MKRVVLLALVIVLVFINLGSHRNKTENMNTDACENAVTLQDTYTGSIKISPEQKSVQSFPVSHNPGNFIHGKSINFITF